LQGILQGLISQNPTFKDFEFFGKLGFQQYFWFQATENYNQQAFKQTFKQ